MRRIFLTSNLSKIIDKLIEKLPQKPQDYSLAYIPTAAFGEGDPSWTTEDRDLLKNVGFKVTEINISDYNQSTLKNELSKYDIIFVEGGNTFYLLQESHKSGFSTLLPDLLDQGKIYIGASAGSVLLGPDIEPVKLFDNPATAPELTSYMGLGLINFVPFVHFGEGKYYDAYLKTLANFYTGGARAILLGDNHFISIEGEKIELC